MIQLIQNLAKCDEKFFSGWILAHARIVLDGKAVFYSNKLLSAAERRAVFSVTGTDENNITRQSLKVLLLLPKATTGKISSKAEIKGSLLDMQKFSVRQINEYIALSGDKNIIHQRVRPIVPGLMMVLYLYDFFCSQSDWDIRFLNPVYADDEVFFYRQNNGVNAYVNNKLVLTIKFKTGQVN